MRTSIKLILLVIVSFSSLYSARASNVIEADVSDAQEICEVVNEAYQRDFFRYRERPRTTYEKVLNYFLDGEHTWYVMKVSKEKGVEIACAVLYSTDNAPETCAEGNVHMLAARKAYWGQHLSIPLLKKVEERAMQDKKSAIRLMVANTNQGLIQLYERLGYSLTGERFELPLTSVQPQYQERTPEGSPTIFCVHMEKILVID